MMQKTSSTWHVNALCWIYREDHRRRKFLERTDRGKVAWGWRIGWRTRIDEMEVKERYSRH